MKFLALILFLVISSNTFAISPQSQTLINEFTSSDKVALEIDKVETEFEVSCDEVVVSVPEASLKIEKISLRTICQSDSKRVRLSIKADVAYTESGALFYLTEVKTN